MSRKHFSLLRKKECPGRVKTFSNQLPFSRLTGWNSCNRHSLFESLRCISREATVLRLVLLMLQNYLPGPLSVFAGVPRGQLDPCLSQSLPNLPAWLACMPEWPGKRVLSSQGTLPSVCSGLSNTPRVPVWKGLNIWPLLALLRMALLITRGLGSSEGFPTFRYSREMRGVEVLVV